jgi:hypothetical protein
MILTSWGVFCLPVISQTHSHKYTRIFPIVQDECEVADPDPASAIKRSDCDTIFIVCNFQPDKKSQEAQVGHLLDLCYN